MPHKQQKDDKKMKYRSKDKPKRDDKWGVKAKRRKARRDKKNRRDFESGSKRWK